MMLSQIIDLEAQLLRDQDATLEALRARDREIFQRMRPAPTEREALLNAWVEGSREGPSIGRAVARSWRTLSVVVGVVGLVVGATTASALLPRGGAPVNVFYYLLVAVGFQLGLLLILALLALVALRWPRIMDQLPGIAELRGALRWAATRLSRRLRPEHRTLIHTLRTRTALYGELERWLILRITQLFGVTFNLGLLGVFGALVVFSELTFGWSTTLVTSRGAFHSLVAALATPFDWLVAAPSEAVVAQTQYAPSLGGYVAGAVAPEVSGRWWPFLAAATVCYGLLPRLALWGLAVIKGRAALRTQPLDTPDIEAALRRLRAPQVQTAAVEVETPLPPSAAPAAKAALEPTPGTPEAVLIRWREFPAEAALLQAAALAVGAVGARIEPAGDGDLAQDRALMAHIQSTQQHPLLFVEGWEAPDRGTRRFLANLRKTVGPRLPIRVLLSGRAQAERWGAATEEQLSIWRELLGELHDPYLAVEPLEALQ